MPIPTLRLQDVRRLLRSAEEHELSADAVQRLKWFQYNLLHGDNVSLTCRHFGISRSTFTRWAERFDPSDVRSLEECSRRPHTVRLPETDVRTIELIRQIRIQQPLLGKEAVTEILRTMHNVVMSSSTVGRVIKRHNLFFAQTASHTIKRSSVEDHPTNVMSVPVRPEDFSDSSETDMDDPLLALFPGITS